MPEMTSDRCDSVGEASTSSLSKRGKFGDSDLPFVGHRVISLYKK